MRADMSRVIVERPRRSGVDRPAAPCRSKIYLTFPPAEADRPAPFCGTWRSFGNKGDLAMLVEGGPSRVRKNEDFARSASFETRPKWPLLRMGSQISATYLTLRKPEGLSRRVPAQQIRIFPHPARLLATT
jgi:hypothetical protein